MKFHNIFGKSNRTAQLYYQISGKRFDALKDHVNENRFIDAPMIFISQLSRSGGTMLCQLFDGHSNCIVFPPELKFASHKTSIADLDALATTSSEIARMRLIAANKSVIEKGLKGCFPKGVETNVPFIFDMFAFNVLFRTLWSRRTPRSGRQVMNIWFSSFFSSWLNYQWPVKISYCTAFASWTGVKEDNVDKFFRYYPDGYLIHVLRDPLSWYDSVKARSDRLHRRQTEMLGIYRDLKSAVYWYGKQAAVFERNLDKYPGRVMLITYDSLVSDRERVMKNICRKVSIDYESLLLRPTFNCVTVGRNTSFRDGKRRNELETHEVDEIQTHCLSIYEKLLGSCI